MLSHKESIELFDALGVDFTPELKGIDAEEGFGDTGLDQASYAAKLVQEYKDHGIDPKRVWLQSFNIDDVLQWIAESPSFGTQAVWLDGRDVAGLAELPPELSEFQELKVNGINVIAPPMPVLLAVEEGEIVPSVYAERAKEAGLKIISWTTERSGRIIEDVVEGGGAFYYQTTLEALENDGDILKTIHVLAKDVGIIGLFSDWPATTTFYANCMLSNHHKKYGGKYKH